MKPLLFVVADGELQQSWRAALRAGEEDWNLHFVETADEALAVLAAQHVALVVTDVSLPGMPGDVFLRQVSERHPGVVRLVLAEGSDEARVLRAAGAAHRLLPEDPARLVDEIRGSLAVRALLCSSELHQIVAGMTELPPAPRTFQELQEEVSAPEPSLSRVAEIVDSEPATAAKVLKVVNSAFYGLARPLIDVGEAVRHLGLVKIRDIVLDTALREAFPSELASTLQLHAVLCSRLAAQLPDDAEEQKIARCAGLVHDVGKLVLATRREGYSNLIDLASVGERPLVDWERDDLGVTHAEIGAHVLELWGLPPAIVEAVALHHEPNRGAAGAFDATGAVHVANVLCSDRELDEPFDLEYLRVVGVEDRIEAWSAAARVLIESVVG